MKLHTTLLLALCAATFGAQADIQKYKAAASDLKKTLGGELKGKMGEGVVVAVEFCSKNAMNITESIAKKHAVNVKRVSDKNRNEKNVPDANDKKAIEAFNAEIAKNKKPMESLTIDGKYYEPMVMSEMCAGCHGKKSEIDKETAAKIKQIYPNDKAINHETGDLRGVMVVW